MNTTDTTKAQNLYPFTTKSQLKARIAADDDFVKECLVVMYNRQTTDEQETKDTKYRNRRGFMSSHAVRGTDLANKVLGGEWLNPEELDLAREIVKSYTKQLASHFRQESLAERPELAEAAKVFGL
jgi:hypothetical protein